MFKKSLLALALTSAALSGVANAATISSGTSVAVSLEGNQNVNLGASALAPASLTTALTTTIGTAYIINDVVTFTVSGAEFLTTGAGAAPTLVGGAATYNFIDYSDANTVRFRVAAADAVAGNGIVLAGWSLKTGSAVDKSKVSFKSTALSSNSTIGAYDTTAVGSTSFNFAKQLTTTITKLNGQVSTGKGRAQFTSTSTSADNDVLTIANTDGAGVNALTIAKAVHVITGDYSWMMDYDVVANGGDLDGILDAGELAAAVTTVGCTSAVATMNTALTALTITDTGAIAASCAIALNNVGYAAGGSVIKAPQSFTMTSTYTDATANAITASASAGAFSLDGSSTDIAFLPFGTDYAQSITVTNDGSVVGAITVTITAGGMAYDTVLVATAAAKTVTNISAEVAAFAAASGVTGDAAINVTTNAPGIVVKGLY